MAKRDIEALRKLGIERSAARRDESLYRPDELAPGVYGCWFLSDGALVLALREHNQEKLVPIVKRGIPRGALGFNTEAQAFDEIAWRKRQGFWPSWTEKAKPVYLIWW